MSGCEGYELLTSLVLDEEATLEEQAELTRHLEACPDCRAYFEDIKRIRAAFVPENIVVPEGFTTRVMDQVRETAQDQPEEKKVIRLIRWRQWAALAACCAVVLLSAWGIHNAASGGARENMAVSARQTQDARSASTQADTAQGADEDILEGEASLLNEEAPPPLPEEYENLAKSAAKDGAGEGDFQSLSDDGAGGPANGDPSAQVPEYAMTVGTANTLPDPAEPDESERMQEDAPDSADADLPAADDTETASEAETQEPPAAEPETTPEAPTEEEAPETAPAEGAAETGPAEVIGVPEPGILIAYSTAARTWVENVLGLEWASGGSYSLSAEQYKDLLQVLRDAGEPYSIEPGEGYCLMTE